MPGEDRAATQRVRYTGRPVVTPLGVEAYAGSLRLTFSQPLDPKRAGAGAAVYGMILLLVLYAFPSGAAGLLRTAYKSLARRAYTPRKVVVPRLVKRRGS